MKLNEFIRTFVGFNTLVRVWYKTPIGHKPIEDNNLKMEWEWLTSEYATNNVLYIKDILTFDGYSEAINIIIENNK